MKFRRIRPIKKVKVIRTAGKVRPKPIRTAGKVTANAAETETPNEETSGGGGGGGGASEEKGQPQEEQSQEEQPQEAQEAQEEQPQEEQSQEMVAEGEEIRFPLTSSHMQNGKVRSATICVSRNGCSILHCDAMPRNVTDIGAEHLPVIMRAHRNILRQKGLFERQKRTAEQLVIRAREGDQNAMAILALTRENALKGYRPAVSAFQYMLNYAKANAVGAAFGAEDETSVEPDTQSSIMLANGPQITYSGIKRICASFGAEGNRRRLFEYGFKSWNDNPSHRQLSARLTDKQREALRLGRTLGKAKALQIVRHPSASLAVYSPIVAWEHGE